MSIYGNYIKTLQIFLYKLGDLWEIYFYGENIQASVLDKFY